MTVEILRAALLKQVGIVREKSVRALRMCKFMPATSNDKGGVIPCSTAEEIGIRANEINAWIEACDGFIKLIELESLKITQPEQKGEPKPKKPKKDFYG